MKNLNYFKAWRLVSENTLLFNYQYIKEIHIETNRGLDLAEKSGSALLRIKQQKDPMLNSSPGDGKLGGSQSTKFKC